MSILRTAQHNTSAFSCSMSFNYHLHGSGVGEISAYVETGTTRLAYWNETRDKTISWQKNQIYIGLVPRNLFYVVFMANHNPPTDGIIALDDITFRACDPGRRFFLIAAGLWRIRHEILLLQMTICVIGKMVGVLGGELLQIRTVLHGRGC